MEEKCTLDTDASTTYNNLSNYFYRLLQKQQLIHINGINSRMSKLLHGQNVKLPSQKHATAHTWKSHRYIY